MKNKQQDSFLNQNSKEQRNAICDLKFDNFKAVMERMMGITEKKNNGLKLVYPLAYFTNLVSPGTIISLRDPFIVVFTCLKKNLGAYKIHTHDSSGRTESYLGSEFVESLMTSVKATPSSESGQNLQSTTIDLDNSLTSSHCANVIMVSSFKVGSVGKVEMLSYEKPKRMFSQLPPFNKIPNNIISPEKIFCYHEENYRECHTLPFHSLFFGSVSTEFLCKVDQVHKSEGLSLVSEKQNLLAPTSDKQIKPFGISNLNFGAIQETSAVPKAQSSIRLPLNPSALYFRSTPSNDVVTSSLQTLIGQPTGSKKLLTPPEVSSRPQFTPGHRNEEVTSLHGLYRGCCSFLLKLVLVDCLIDSGDNNAIYTVLTFCEVEKNYFISKKLSVSIVGEETYNSFAKKIGHTMGLHSCGIVSMVRSSCIEIKEGDAKRIVSFSIDKPIVQNINSLVQFDESHKFLKKCPPNAGETTVECLLCVCASLPEEIPVKDKIIKYRMYVIVSRSIIPVKVEWFKHSNISVPNSLEIGDTLLIRNMLLKPYRGWYCCNLERGSEVIKGVVTAIQNHSMYVMMKLLSEFMTLYSRRSSTYHDLRYLVKYLTSVKDFEQILKQGVRRSHSHLTFNNICITLTCLAHDLDRLPVKAVCSGCRKNLAEVDDSFVCPNGCRSWTPDYIPSIEYIVKQPDGCYFSEIIALFEDLDSLAKLLGMTNGEVTAALESQKRQVVSDTLDLGVNKTIVADYLIEVRHPSVLTLVITKVHKVLNHHDKDDGDRIREDNAALASSPKYSKHLKQASRVNNNNDEEEEEEKENGNHDEEEEEEAVASSPRERYVRRDSSEVEAFGPNKDCQPRENSRSSKSVHTLQTKSSAFLLNVEKEGLEAFHKKSSKEFFEHQSPRQRNKQYLFNEGLLDSDGRTQSTQTPKSEKHVLGSVGVVTNEAAMAQSTAKHRSSHRILSLVDEAHSKITSSKKKITNEGNVIRSDRLSKVFNIENDADSESEGISDGNGEKTTGIPKRLTEQKIQRKLQQFDKLNRKEDESASDQ